MTDRFDTMLRRSMKIAGGAVVTYTPQSGDPVTVTVMPSAEDRVSSFGDSRILSDGATFEVLKSELDAPAKGDSFSYKGENFTVKSSRLIDEERLIWLLDCYPS